MIHLLSDKAEVANVLEAAEKIERVEQKTQDLDKR